MTWNEPPPTQIIEAVANPVDHFSSRQLREGNMDANLSWQFNLTELKFDLLEIFFDMTSIAGADSSGSAPQSGFENQFGIDWSPNQNFVRLIIFNVTIEVNGTFSCRVTAKRMKGVGSFLFESIVRVDVVGKVKILFVI